MKLKLLFISLIISFITIDMAYGQETQALNSTMIASGIKHTISSCSNGIVSAVGDGASGKLGDGTTNSRNQPVQVSTITNVTVGVSAHELNSYAIKSDYTLWAWGDNTYGQIGDNTTTQRNSPVQVLTNVKKVVAGWRHAIALKNDGTVWTWGLNDNGQLGDGTITGHSAPAQVTALSGTYIDIAAGKGHSIAVKSDGTVWAWGINSLHQIGDNTTTQRNSPVQITTLSGIKAVASQNNHSLALTTGGTLWAWGDNSTWGELGNGNTNATAIPVLCVTSGTFTQIATGSAHSMALNTNGTVWTWGCNFNGQLGNGSADNTAHSSPTQAHSSLAGINAIAGSDAGGFAIKGTTTYAWGKNNNYLLGDGTQTQRNTPVAVNLCSLVGIDELYKSENEPVIKPSVNNGDFTILLSNAVKSWQVTVYSLVGQKVYEEAIKSGVPDKSFHLENLPAGVYFVNISVDGKQFLKRMIKE